MKNSNRGVSLTELLVTLLVCVILVLMVGAISSISNASYDKANRETGVYNDIYYAFNLMESDGRNAKMVSVNNTNKSLTFDSVTFKKNNNDFVFVDAGGNHPVVSGVTNLNFNFYCTQDVSGNWVSNSCSSNSGMFHITLSGEKSLNVGGKLDKVVFNLYTDVKRRE
ncbi:MAG: hypothetical protein PHN57_00950 [Candidatus Omnitrophica bacterium]|nr:hypothetical protein [Candidatus Omnitrophota bacterium]